MHTLRITAWWVLCTALFCAGVLLIGTFAPTATLPTMRIVLSGSMEPVMPVGSAVFVMPSAQYVVGDIITFGTGNIPTTHRVAHIEHEAGHVRYITKGDANEERDNESTSYDAVVGKVVYTVPRLGYVLAFARTQNGYLAMVVVPAGLIILDELLVMYAAMRGMRRKRREASETGIVYGNGNNRPHRSYPGTGSVPEYVSVSAYAPTRIRTPYTTPVSMDGVVRTRTPMREQVQENISGYIVNLRTT